MLYDPLNDYDEVGKALRRAASYIEEHGHLKGRFEEREGGPVCILGAIGMVTVGTSCIYLTYGKHDEKRLADECEQILSKKISYRHVPAWNDDPRRTKDEVIELLYKVAEEHKLAKV